MSTTAPTDRLAFPEPVQVFAREQGLMPYLSALGEVTEQVFAGARRLTVEVHADPDVPALRWLIFRAEVPWTDPAPARAARDEWYARTAAVCPGPISTNVGLDLDRRPE